MLDRVDYRAEGAPMKIFERTFKFGFAGLGERRSG
jgi:hypothetical protein